MRDPGAVPRHHNHARAEKGGGGEPEISKVIAGVDGPHEPEDRGRRGKEHRNE